MDKTKTYGSYIVLIIVIIKNGNKQKHQKSQSGSLGNFKVKDHTNKSGEIQRNMFNRNKKTNLESNDSEKNIKIISIC